MLFLFKILLFYQLYLQLLLLKELLEF